MNNWKHIKQVIDIMKRKVIIKSGNMFTNEVDWDETITTVMDETGREEDVVVFIADTGVYIRQFNEKNNNYDLISMNHKMFSEMIQAMKHEEGFFRTEIKRV